MRKPKSKYTPWWIAAINEKEVHIKNLEYPRDTHWIDQRDIHCRLSDKARIGDFLIQTEKPSDKNAQIAQWKFIPHDDIKDNRS